MARRAYTETERAAVREHRAALAAAAKAADESRPGDVSRAVEILGHYSRRNAALILVQAELMGRPLPQAVAGFHEWRKLGRTVRKGAKGYAIWAPIVGKKGQGGDDGATDDGTPRGFTIRFVFDVADTDPATVPAGVA
jgi:hypothetical protein